MGTETERKFLTRDDSWRASVARATRINQGYLSLDPDRTVRVRTRDDEATLGVKGRTVGIKRPEYEVAILLADALEMQQMCVARVEKLRHEVEFAGHTWEVDVFLGLNAPLIMAEIELHTSDETFERPAWLGEEVSHDPAYFNSSLAVRPFSLWSEEDLAITTETDLRAYIVSEYRRMKKRRDRNSADKAYWEGRMDALRELATHFELFEGDEEFEKLPV
jgi:adenylate cyclase